MSVVSNIKGVTNFRLQNYISVLWSIKNCIELENTYYYQRRIFGNLSPILIDGIDEVIMQYCDFTDKLSLLSVTKSICHKRQKYLSTYKLRKIELFRELTHHDQLFRKSDEKLLFNSAKLDYLSHRSVLIKAWCNQETSLDLRATTLIIFFCQYIYKNPRKFRAGVTDMGSGYVYSQVKDGLNHFIKTWARENLVESIREGITAYLYDDLSKFLYP